MTIRNILLSRTDRIGDVILTTPAISLLHKQYPEANISFLTRSYTAPLLKYHNYLNEILIYDPLTEHHGVLGCLKLSKYFRSKNFDLAVLFYPEINIASALKLAGIPHRVGTGYRWFSFLLNNRIYEHRKHGDRHELEYNLSLLQNFLDHLPSPDEIEFDFKINRELIKLKTRTLEEENINSPYIIIHPGSGGSAPNLPLDMFVKIINYVAQHTIYRIILAGNASEMPLIDEISEKAEIGYLIKIVGKWNLEQYMAVIAGADFFISNSTGPLHIARAFDIPLMSFYCPAVPCSPKRWGPYNRIESVLVPDIEPCKTCNIKKCPHGNCLSHIKWKQIRSLLDQKLSELNG